MNDLRWFAKKAGRRAISRVTGLPGRLINTRPCLRVLTYHRFACRRRDPFSIDPAHFEAQIVALAASGRVVGLDAVRSILGGQTGDLADDAVMISIDDGAASTIEVAAPILRRHGVPAVAFITAGRIGAAAGDEPERFLDRDEVRALPGFGITIGSHGYEHVSLGALNGQALDRQFAASKDVLEALTGREVASFAYPYGTRADFGAASRAGAARASYRACFTSQHGAVRSGCDPLALPRIKIEGGDPWHVFESATNGGLDHWALVDRTLDSLQASPATDSLQASPATGDQRRTA